MLRRNSTNANFVFTTISEITFVHIGQSRNSTGLIKTHQPTSRSLNGILNTTHTSHAEVSHCHSRISTISSFTIPFLSYLIILMSDSGISTCTPKLALKNTFQPLNDPRKIRMGISHFYYWNTHINDTAFGQATNFNRQVSQIMESLNAVQIIVSGAQLDIHIFTVVHFYEFPRLVKKFRIHNIHQVFLNKRLNTCEYHFIILLTHCLTRSKITHQFSHITRIHPAMSMLISITQQKSHSIIHIYTSFLIFNFYEHSIYITR